MKSHYEFLGLPEPTPVNEVIAHAKQTGETAKEDAADRRAKFAAITGATLLASGVIAAADYAFENDPVTQKFKAQEQGHVIEVTDQQESLPADPRDLKVTVAPSPEK